MTNPSTLKDDISFMRRLAEQGRSGPILGGAFLAAAGLVFGVTCFVQWFVMSGDEAPVPGHIITLWVCAFVLYAVIWGMLNWWFRGRTGAAAAASNFTFGMAWIGSGVGITVACVAIAIVAVISHAAVVMQAYIPMIFAFYGVAWFVAGAMARRGWMYFASAASFTAALLLALLTRNPLQVLAMGVALLLLLTAPGLMLVSEEIRK